MACDVTLEWQLYFAFVCQLNHIEVQWAVTYRLIGKSSVAGADHVALAAIQIDHARGDQHPP